MSTAQTDINQMNKPIYPFTILDNGERFEFESVSEYKRIRKIIEFRQLDIPNLYNVALVDVLQDGSYDDMRISDNNDMETVMATVMKIIQLFLTSHIKAKVMIMGSTASRTRLYRIIINKYLSDFELNYEIHGIVDWKNEVFRRNKNYDAFLIFLRVNN